MKLVAFCDNVGRASPAWVRKRCLIHLHGVWSLILKNPENFHYFLRGYVQIISPLVRRIYSIVSICIYSNWFRLSISDLSPVLHLKTVFPKAFEGIELQDLSTMNADRRETIIPYSGIIYSRFSACTLEPCARSMIILGTGKKLKFRLFFQSLRNLLMNYYIMYSRLLQDINLICCVQIVVAVAPLWFFFATWILHEIVARNQTRFISL